jgi:uncharacterized peroxidase-related enzyme
MAYQAPGVIPSENPVLAEIEKKTGPMNFFRVMAHHPKGLEAFANLYTSVMGPGTVDTRLKEIVYLAVSTVNECEYCTEHHRKSSRPVLNEQEVHEIETEQGQNFSPKEQAALHYARELTRTASVDDNIRYRLQEYFSTDQVVELTMVVGLANFTNRFNNGLAVPLESDVLTRPV